MTPASLPTVPPRVLARVQHALATLRAWPAAVMQARRMEALAHQPGRYEHDLRFGVDASSVQRRLDVAAALDLLAQFETLSHANAVDPQAVYAAHGGRPALLAEGPQVQAWRAPR